MWVHNIESLSIKPYPLRIDSKKSLFWGSAYSLTGPSFILNPSLHSLSVMSVKELRALADGSPMTENYNYQGKIFSYSWNNEKQLLEMHSP